MRAGLGPLPRALACYECRREVAFDEVIDVGRTVDHVLGEGDSGLRGERNRVEGYGNDVLCGCSAYRDRDIATDRCLARSNLQGVGGGRPFDSARPNLGNRAIV